MREREKEKKRETERKRKRERERERDRNENESKISRREGDILTQWKREGGWAGKRDCER